MNVKIQLEYVVYGLRDVAVQLHNTGRSDGKVLDEHLTTVIHLDAGKIRRLDTFISDVAMLNAYFVRNSATQTHPLGEAAEIHGQSPALATSDG